MNEPTSSPTDHRSPGSTAVLDHDRTAQVRMFLTVEAAADVASGGSTATSWASGRRRLAVGVVAAVVLGGALFTANALVGGPGVARTPQVVAITEDDGWTTVRITDIDADPQAVVDQLEAAGISAHVSKIPASEDGGPVTIGNGTSGGAAFGTFHARSGGPGDHGLAGLSVSMPESAVAHPPSGDTGTPATHTSGSPTSGSSTSGSPRSGSGGAEGGPLRVETTGGASGEDARAEMERNLEKQGVRMGDDGTVSIRNGSGNSVIVYTS